MDRDSQPSGAAPNPLLSMGDGVFLTIGLVIGVGIFKLPAQVAASTADARQFLAVWLLGGLASLCGALVYAELAARRPETGGEYAFLARGIGRGAAFVFAWCRMTVIQTGSIAAVAFAFGDYASQILPLGAHGSALWAVLAIGALTGLNVAGTRQSKSLQKVAEIALVGALVLLALAALARGGAPAAPAGAAPGASFGLAMVFVLFAYGGWNEAAYLAGELRDAPRNMARVLVLGIAAVTAVYLLVNLAYLATLGLGGIRASQAVAADAMRAAAGEHGARLLAALVCVSALTTINAAIFTGARTTWALGRDYPLLGALGAWREPGSTPANALIAQAAVTLVLVLAGSATPDGFGAMVAYTAPVFWTFFLLTGVTLFVFRARERRAAQAAPGFRAPLFPLVPAAFVATCGYMLWSSLAYVRDPVYGPKFGAMALAGIAVMAAGVPLYFFARRGAPCAR
ncbi:MAG TPA: APC family permease [Burkholderiales bacterium]|nr:APC family permease [Burkholderiales bacterium]